ncbi:hypothetical protein BC830DRAFT_87267 [Chytriomyces sp. MP71]|nr:hypothetical protein BC830DRAFT_87267 [Chytriomyces sp. MP71]
MSALQTLVPPELVQRIFARIDPSHVLRFKRLCRFVRAALSDPHFATLNLRHFAQIGTVASTSNFRLWFQWPSEYQEKYAGRALASLFEFKCPWKGIEGVIPRAIGSCKNLTHLNLTENALSGSIPRELCQLKQLVCLYINGNRLHGPLPDGLGGLINLQQLNLAHNALSGPIPASIGRLKNLQSLYLNNNCLEGSLPASFGDCSSLKSAYIENNYLVGDIPAQLANLSKIQILYLAGGQNAFNRKLSEAAPRNARVWEILMHQGFRF